MDDQKVYNNNNNNNDVAAADDDDGDDDDDDDGGGGGDDDDDDYGDGGDGDDDDDYGDDDDDYYYYGADGDDDDDVDKDDDDGNDDDDDAADDALSAHLMQVLYACSRYNHADSLALGLMHVLSMSRMHSGADKPPSQPSRSLMHADNLIPPLPTSQAGMAVSCMHTAIWMGRLDLIAHAISTSLV